MQITALPAAFHRAANNSPPEISADNCLMGLRCENIIRSMRLMRTRIDAPVEKMITHQYPLAQVNEALQSHIDLSAMVPVVNHAMA